MRERRLKINVNFSWHLIWIFALLEGITVPLVPLFSDNGPDVNSTAHTATVAARFVSFAVNLLVTGVYGISIGFIGTLVVCLVLNYVVFPRRKFHLTDTVIMRASKPVITGLWGGLLLANIFWIYQCSRGLAVLSWVVTVMILGFFSAAGSVIVTSAIYLLTIKALPHLGIQLITTGQRLLLTGIPIASFACLVGLYEGLASPILYIWQLVPHHRVLIACLVGLSGGALSSLIVVALAHLRVMNRHLWLEFSIIR